MITLTVAGIKQDKELLELESLRPKERASRFDVLEGNRR